MFDYQPIDTTLIFHCRPNELKPGMNGDGDNDVNTSPDMENHLSPKGLEDDVDGPDHLGQKDPLVVARIWSDDRSLHPEPDFTMQISNKASHAIDDTYRPLKPWQGWR